MSELLERGADPNKDQGKSILLYAIDIQRTEVQLVAFRKLLMAGGCVQLVDTKECIHPLIYAIEKNKNEAVCVLLEHGISIKQEQVFLKSEN